MTVESFLQWKEKFDAELEALKSQKQKELEAAMKAKLSIYFFIPKRYTIVGGFTLCPQFIVTIY